MIKTRGGLLAKLGSASLVCSIGAFGCDGPTTTGDVGAPRSDSGPRPDVYVPPGVDASLDAFADDAFTPLDDAYVPPGVDAALDAARSPGPTCEAPPPPSPLVTLPCDPIPAPPSCVAGPHMPVLRWSFDPAAPTDDAIGSRNIVAAGLNAMSDTSAVGGGFAFVDDPRAPQSSGSGTIIPAGSAATVEMLLRFRTPVDWSGSAGSGHGGRTELLNLAATVSALELSYEREKFIFAVNGQRADFTMREGGVANWAALADGSFHHIAFVFTPRGANLQVDLHVDGESPTVLSTTLMATSLPAVTRVMFGNRTYRPHGLDVDEFSLYAEALPATMIAQHAREAAARMPLSAMDACALRTCTRPTSTGELVPALQAPGYDTAHLYAATTSPTAQFESAPLPGHRRGHTMPRFIASWITSYLANNDNPVPLTQAPTDHQLEADTARAPMAQELARHWNYGLSAQLSGEANARPDTNPYVAVLRSSEADAWPVDTGLLGSDEGSGRLGLFNASGARIGISPGDSLMGYRAYGAANASRIAALESRIGHPLDAFYVDFEGESFTTMETAQSESLLALPANRTAQTECARRGLTLRPCLAQTITEYRNAIVEGALSAVTHRPAVHFYEVDGNEHYRGDFAYTRLQNDPQPRAVDPASDASDAYRPSTSSLYPLNPGRLYETLGASHGLNWFFEARAYEIAHGSRFAMPYVAAGWSYNEHENIRPPQWLGFLQIAGVSGALNSIPAFFVIPSAVGSGSCSWGVCNDAECMGDTTCRAQTVQNPNHRAWQTLTPSYAQGALSFAESIVRDPASVWLGELPTNGPHAIATARRLGDRFLIAVLHTTHGNDTARFARTSSSVWVGLDDDGVAATPPLSIRVEARAQGSLYVYDLGRDAGESGPTLVQLDRWHEVTHPSRWSAAFDREVEVNDARQDVVVATEAPLSASRDYTLFDSFVRVAPARASENFGTSASAPYVELDVESRAGGAHAIWVRARTTREAGRVVVRVGEGAPIELGCVSSNAWQWVRLDCGSATPSSTTLAPDTRTTLRVSPSHGGIEIDRIIVTPETMCIAASVSCACE